MKQVDCIDLDEPDDIEFATYDPSLSTLIDEVMALQALDDPGNNPTNINWILENSPHVVGDRNGEFTNNDSNFSK